MLLSFGAKNFYCFKEGVEISFELTSNCPKKISKGKPVSKLVCVKGANGSGKTNALKILSFLKDFCTDSFNNKPDEKVLIFSYFGNDNPINLYCDFEIGGTVYSYELSLTQNHIISESLARTKKRSIEIFTREGNEFKDCIKEFSELSKMKLRSNASIISTAHQYEIDNIKPIYTFFNNILSNVYWSGRRDIPKDYNLLSKFYMHNDDVFEFSKDIIRRFDLGIKDITIQIREDENEKQIFYPMFEHDAEVKNNKLTYYDQSSGTKELYAILPFYKVTLDIGGVLILDEFDINLHPHILPLLIKLFDDEKSNPLNAQMIFTTHNDNIIDDMGKYRTIIVNKDKSESYAYRLDEIPGDILRNDRPIAPIYNAGKIGGVPKV